MRYHATSGVALRASNPPFFTTPEGGVVVTDELLAHLWTEARASTADEITGRFATHPDLGASVVEAVACLAEAGLLERATPARRSPSPVVSEGPLVSIVVVVSSVRELEYLGDCLQSIVGSSYRPIELLLVRQRLEGRPGSARAHACGAGATRPVGTAAMSRGRMQRGNRGV